MKINHKRMKPKAGAAPTAEEKRFMGWVAECSCLACGRRPVTIHHVTSDGFKRIARSHKRIVPLCAMHHLIQHGPTISVEALGHAGFRDRWGVDLLVEAESLWEKWNEKHHSEDAGAA